MISDDDIKRLAKEFATKSDLGNFATKDDLKRFATKDDLEDLQRVVTNLAVEVMGIKGEIVDIKENMVTKEDHREIRTLMDRVLKELVEMRQEQVVHSQRHEDNDREHQEIKKRLHRVESVPVIAHEIKKRS